mmetsp:Transcript_23751/g.49323  ORF Transcript_23751/g.49323 Transcript_23751/m.49323 type:complete len:343 (+) Transcript_23751:86-1114(+)
MLWLAGDIFVTVARLHSAQDDLLSCLFSQTFDTSCLGGSDSGNVWSPRGNDLGFFFLGFSVAGDQFRNTHAGKCHGGLFATLFLHTTDLVSDNLSPVGSVFVGLHNNNIGARVAVGSQQQQSLFTAVGHSSTISTFHAFFVRDLTFLGINSRVNDRNTLSNQFIGTDDQSQRSQSRRFVFNQHTVQSSQDASRRHVPPSLCVHGDGFSNVELSSFVVVDQVFIRRMHFITGRGRVDLEEFFSLFEDIFMTVDTNFVVDIFVGHGSIDTDGTFLHVINGANVESILVTTEQSRLTASITRSSSTNDRRLNKDATSTVGVRTFLGVNGGEGDTVLVILSQMEMS